MNPLLNRVMSGFHAIEDIVRILSIISMTLIIFIQVVARLFFKWSSPALEEAARFIMIWAIFIGAVVTTREDGHIKMGGVFKSEKGKMWFELISKIITVGFFFIFVYLAYDYTAYSIRKGMNSIVLDVPLIVVHSCFLVTGILMTFHSSLYLIKQINEVIQFYKGERK